MKSKSIIIATTALCIIAAIIGIWWYISSKNEGTLPVSSQPEYFNGFESLGGIPSRTDIATSTPELLVAWQDQTVVDGNFSCQLYKKDTRQIVASYYQTSGFNPEHKTSSNITYKDSSISKDTINQIVENYCKRD